MAEKDVLWKNFIADPEYKAVTDTIAPTGLLHDYYQLDVRGPLPEEVIEKLKDMIVENGAVRASHWGADSAQQGFFNYGEWYSTNEAVNHGQVLVGWDDDYLFKLKDEDGNELKGAFIMKNSWGSTVGKAGCRRCLYLCRLWLGAE
ncbi:C1 family peptidase [Selenomonas ruminantium]|nr:C1 family peptidase [Selenomonas ruminantium]